MKNIKKILALLLAAAMCLLLLAACGSTASDTAEEPAEDTAAETETAAEETETEEETEEPAEEAEEPAEEAEEEEKEDGPLFDDVEITVLLAKDSDTGDQEAHQDALNAYVEDVLGVKVNLQVLAIGTYATQLSLAMSGGETVDLAAITPVPGSTFTSITSNSQAMPLNDLLEEYGQGILEAAGDYLSAGTVNGQIYSVPVLRQKASNLYVDWNTELGDELGVTDAMKNATCFADLEAVMQAVVDADIGVYPCAGEQYLNGYANFIWGDGDFADIVSYEAAGDSVTSVYLDEDGNVARLIDNENYIAQMKMFEKWYEAGYVWPDTVTNAETTGKQLVGQGISFMDFCATELGGEATASQQAGIPISMTEMCGGMVSAGNFTAFCTFIPVTAQEPEAAMAFLNLLYTDATAMNLMCWGVEGENYVVEDGVACCPEGTDVTTCGWHMPDFFIGNSFLLIPWDGSSADFRTLAEEDLANSTMSSAFGFSLDATLVQDYVAALTGVHQQYWYSCMSGLYTDDMLEEYRTAQDAADISGYMSEIQRQIDEWRS